MLGFLSHPRRTYEIIEEVNEMEFNSLGLQNRLEEFLGLEEIPQLKKWDGENFAQLEVAYLETFGYDNIQERDEDYNAMVKWIKENYEADCPYCEVGNCLIDEFTMCDGASGDIDGLIEAMEND